MVDIVELPKRLLKTVSIFLINLALATRWKSNYYLYCTLTRTGTASYLQTEIALLMSEIVTQ